MASASHLQIHFHLPIMIRVILRKNCKTERGNCFVVTESVFSMDGDLAPLAEMAKLCEQYEADLIVDEAHATGIIGERGEGLVQFLGICKIDVLPGFIRSVRRWDVMVR